MYIYLYHGHGFMLSLDVTDAAVADLLTDGKGTATSSKSDLIQFHLFIYICR